MTESPILSVLLDISGELNSLILREDFQSRDAGVRVNDVVGHGGNGVTWNFGKVTSSQEC